MLPDPLHPAVVHLPIALAALVPLIAILAAIAVATRFVGPRAWSLVVVLQALFAFSAWLATETGEREEDRVERVVAERLIEAHEEKARTLRTLAFVGFAVSAIGLAAGSIGAVGRAGFVFVSLILLAAAVRVGQSGGDLVYKHGAALAYVDQAPGAGLDRISTGHHDEDDDD